MMASWHGNVSGGGGGGGGGGGSTGHLMVSFHKGPVLRNFGVFFDVSMDKLWRHGADMTSL